AGVHNQAQSLDASNTHFLTISGTGTFQNIVGTNFNDKLTAAPLSFDPTTQTLTPGTNFNSGFGQDKVFGTLGTTAVMLGSGSQFTESLDTNALNVIGQVASNPTLFSQLRSNVQLTGGNSFAQASVLSNLNLSGGGNQFTGFVDAATASKLASLAHGFDAT